MLSALFGNTEPDWQSWGLIALLFTSLGAIITGRLVPRRTMNARIADKDEELARQEKMFAARLADRDKQIEYLAEASEQRRIALNTKDAQIETLLQTAQLQIAALRGIEKAVRDDAG